MAYNKKEVLQANTEAIRVVLRLEKERREATEAEKSILRNYQGFGGLKCVLNRTDTPDDIRYWIKSEQNLFEPTQQLKQMIYREAVDANTAKRYWESIKASVLTSFYTDTRIVSAISGALASNLQVRRCLDPSMGMGAFAETFARQAGVVDAMEKDLLTARISQTLHPYGKSNIFVRNEPFEAIGELEDKDKYDLVTSNIPFGDFMVYDREYSKGKDTLKRESTRAIHNYFFVKGLDCIKEGGLLAFITSQGVLDSPRNEAIRRYLMQNSRLISALRLPSGMFSDNAGTDVGSDLIVLQKQTGKEISKGFEQQFVESVSVPKEEGSSVVFKHNSLFVGDWTVLSGNTDLLEKARLDKKITTLESERKNFLRERDAANGKLAEIESSVSFHTDKIKEAQSDLALFEQRIERDADGQPINKLIIKGAEESTDIKAIAARLQEIDEKARTKGEYNKIGEIYGFSIMVKTESTSKDLFDCSVNRFFVKGQESIYYTYNNGKLASDPKLACENFVNALERIPKVIESHEKEMAKVVTNKDVYTNIANSSWKKEDELRSLKSEAAELDRKIALTLAPPEEEKEEKEKVGQEENLSDNNHSARVKNESHPAHDKEEDYRSQNFRPKWRR